jgi:hypothetical protein
VTKVQANRWDGQQWVKIGTMDLTEPQIEGLRVWADAFNRTTDAAQDILAEREAGRWQPSKVEYVSLIWVWHNGLFKCGVNAMPQGQMHRIIGDGKAQVREWYDRETNTVTTETPEQFKGWGKS